MRNKDKIKIITLYDSVKVKQRSCWSCIVTVNEAKGQNTHHLYSTFRRLGCPCPAHDQSEPQAGSLEGASTAHCRNHSARLCDQTGRS